MQPRRQPSNAIAKLLRGSKVFAFMLQRVLSPQREMVPLSAEQIAAFAESVSNIRVEDQEGAFRPIARLLGVPESEMASQFQVVAGYVTRPRHVRRVNRI